MLLRISIIQYFFINLLFGIYMHFRRGEKNNLKIFILLYCKLLKAISNVHPSEIIVTLFYDGEFNIWCWAIRQSLSMAELPIDCWDINEVITKTEYILLFLDWQAAPQLSFEYRYLSQRRSASILFHFLTKHFSVAISTYPQLNFRAVYRSRTRHFDGYIQFVVNAKTYSGCIISTI